MKLRTLHSKIPHIVHEGVIITVHAKGKQKEKAITHCGRTLEWFTSEENVREFFGDGRKYSRKCKRCFQEKK